MRAAAWPLLLLLAFGQAGFALHNGIPLVPAMGWSSWNTFRCDISSALVLDVADAMVSSGLREAGYLYVSIDDCWMLHERDASGHLVVDAAKFPEGMKWLGDEIHARGLLFGIYSAAGNKTCEGKAASWGHEDVDAADFASWGVDYLKYDFCDCQNGCDTQQSYTTMGRALNATGRQFMYNICSWGGGSPHTWGASVAHSWRTGRDLFATFSVESEKQLGLPGFLQSVMSAVDGTDGVAAFGEPGFAPDPDMLLVGVPGMVPYGIVDVCPPAVPDCTPGQYITRERWGPVGGLTPDEEASHLALWAMLASPLMLGNDPRKMKEATRELLTSPGVLAIDQDPLGTPARRSWREVRGGNGGEVFSRPLEGGAVALLLLNRDNEEARDVAALWERDLSVGVKAGPCGPDKHRAWCPGWAQSGECDTNTAFMKAGCATSCPQLCDLPEPPPAPSAASIPMSVTDAWTGKEVGVFARGVQAKALPPHAHRLLVVRPAPQRRRHSQESRLSEPSEGAGVPVAVVQGTAAAVCALCLCTSVLLWRVMVRIRRARRAR